MVQTPELEDFAIEVTIKMFNIRVQLEWLQWLKKAQAFDEELSKLKEKTQEKEGNDFHLDEKGLLCFRGRCCVPN
jgi:predicted ATP-grasp superfamily ATP-dependent carboligase